MMKKIFDFKKLPAIAAFAFAILFLFALGAISEQGYERSDLRSFYTAPPVIPHEITDQNGQDCILCHSDVIELGDRTTVKTPHPQFSNCLQCHLMSISPLGDSPPPPSTWEGLEEPTEGGRHHTGAPPVIPHRLFLRDNCLSCHHPDHPNEDVRCPHPERTLCRGCHMADAANEF